MGEPTEKPAEKFMEKLWNALDDPRIGERIRQIAREEKREKGSLFGKGEDSRWKEEAERLKRLCEAERERADRLEREQARFRRMAQEAEERIEEAEKKAEEAETRAREAERKIKEAGRRVEAAEGKAEEAEKKAEEATERLDQAKRQAEAAQRMAETAEGKAEEAEKKSREATECLEQAKRQAEAAQRQAEAAQREADEAQGAWKEYERRYGRLDHYYQIYAGMGSGVHAELARVLSAESPERFLCHGFQWENLEALWEFMAISISRGSHSRETIQGLSEIFDYFFERYGEFAGTYERLDTKVGERFDEGLHQRSGESRVAGSITQVLLRGYRGKTNKKVQKSLVKI